MPITPSIPSIFPAELSRDERAIAALPSSITAFVGRAQRGPLDQPVSLASSAEFARSFGAPDDDDSLGRAVQAFFENGGGEAVVVRVARGAKPARLEHGALKLSAASPGGWGNQLRMRTRRGLDAAFHLQIRDGVTGRMESHPSLTFHDGPRRVDRVLNAQSRLVRWTAQAPRAQARILEHAAAPAAGRTPWSDDATSTKVERAGRGSDGCELTPADFVGAAKQATRRGLYALERAGLFNLLVIPPHRAGRQIEAALWRSAAGYCAKRRAFLIVDPNLDCVDLAQSRRFLETLGLQTPDAAIFFERLTREVLPSGAVAVLLARTDAQRGPWKVPASMGATLAGVATGDAPAGDSESVAARRMALFLEGSLRHGLRWVESERNDESLWAQIRASAGAFLHGFLLLGAFPARAPRDAYFVRCDEQTTSRRDLERGIVNLVVGFAPRRPGEFATLALPLPAKLPT